MSEAAQTISASGKRRAPGHDNQRLNDPVDLRGLAQTMVSRHVLPELLGRKDDRALEQLELVKPRG